MLSGLLVLTLFFFYLCSSAWRLWQMRLQQLQDFYTLEDQALKQRALTLQSRVKTWSNAYIVNIMRDEYWSSSFVLLPCLILCGYMWSSFLKIWLQWKEMHKVALCQREKESKAEVHFILRLKRQTLHHWKSYVSCLQTKKKSQGQS